MCFQDRLNCNFVIVFVIVFLSLACSTQSMAENEVRDQLGRQVSIPGDVDRLIPLAPSIAEYVYLLGKWDQVVGVTRFANYPTRAKGLPKVGSYVNLDLEKIIDLNPDLCLATKDGNPKSVVSELEQLGVPVYALDPRDVDAIGHTLLKLGNLLNAGYRAEKILGRMEARFDRIKGLVQESEYRPRVFFQIGISPIVSAGENTIVHELIQNAGGRNVVHSDKPYPRFSREDILQLRPDMIVVSSMSNKEEKFEQAKDMWSEFDSIPAVQKGRIYSVNSDLVNRPSPRIIQGLNRLFKLFHPDLAVKLPKNGTFFNKIER